MALTENELIALIILARNVEWRYQLDDYETEVLQKLLVSVRRAEREVIDALSPLMSDWSEARALAILDELSDLTLGIKAVLHNSILDIAATAGASSYLAHNSILSFDGRVPDFNYVSLTADQLKTALTGTPVGGKLLNEWLMTNYDSKIEGIRQEVMTGLLKGDDYRQFTSRLQGEFGLAREDAVSLARTYVQSVNVGAMENLYEANADIIKGWKWTAALESGYKKTGRGTCLRCAVLDGTVYKEKEPRPPMPLHIRCRCVWLPELISWKQLGLDIPEMEEAYRPYTIRPDKSIGVGGRRTIIEHGFYGEDYAEWMKTRSESFRRDLVGPRRLELLKSGQKDFKDLVDHQTGKLLTLQELGV